MTKFVMCITRHLNMSGARFQDYWRNSHGPFFIRNADAMGAKGMFSLIRWTVLLSRFSP